MMVYPHIYYGLDDVHVENNGDVVEADPGVPEHRGLRDHPGPRDRDR